MSNKLNIVGRIEPFLFQLIDEEREREREIIWIKIFARGTIGRAGKNYWNGHRTTCGSFTIGKEITQTISHANRFLATRVTRCYVRCVQ